MNRFNMGDEVLCTYPINGDHRMVGAAGKVMGQIGDDVLVDWSGGRQEICKERHLKMLRPGPGNPMNAMAYSGGYMPKSSRLMSVGAMPSSATWTVDELGDVHEAVDKPKVKKIKVDESKLDALIMDEKTKGEIVSVLKQHSNHKKIFKEWGLEETIEYGVGMTFLFHGPPGTGKTWAANLMAKSIGAELLTIGMAEIQSSEPGAANRNIQNAFKEAEENGKILFIDECDSLIFDRKHLGMVLAGEVNTLLQEIEKYKGVLILATNQINRMDEALERRISLIVKFKNPDFAQRKDIWAKLLPKKMPLHESVTLDALAKHEISGGFIKNAVLQAARTACSEEKEQVHMDHFDAAITRIKSSKNLMGKLSGQRAIMEDSDQGTGAAKVDSFFSDVTSVIKKDPDEKAE